LMAAGGGLAPGASGSASAAGAGSDAGASAGVDGAFFATSRLAASPVSPLRTEVARLEAGFGAALEARDVPVAVRTILAAAETNQAWSRDTEESGELDAARAAMRSMVVRLGELAISGARDPRDVVGPFVDALVELRLAARKAGDWATADAVRDRLLAAGIELHDTPDGTTWELRDASPVR
ncbi:MAG: CysS/YqeB C-terminal domain-containing protein, partial [Candidatus Limnocylindrales bacterium]